MFGFLIGTASLIGLFVVLKRGRHDHGHGHRGFNGRRSWMLRWLFQRLDTTPGQEKVLHSAADDLEGRMREIWSELEQARRDVARGMRGPQYDASAVRESFARVRAHLDTLEESVVAHGGKLHEALDDRQRLMFADLLEQGPRRAMHGGCGHRRHASHWKYA